MEAPTQLHLFHTQTRVFNIKSSNLTISNEAATRGVHGPVRSDFNPKIQPNRKMIFFINTTRTEPRTGSNQTGFVRFGLVF
jgi:hypothetical protein